MVPETFINAPNVTTHNNYETYGQLSPRINKRNMYRSKIFFISAIFCAALFIAMSMGFAIHYRKTTARKQQQKMSYEWNKENLCGDNNLTPEQKIWFDKGNMELSKALKRKTSIKQAKNVILFVGDGMGPNSITAARIYEQGEEGLLAWEEFPNMGLLKTYCANKLVPDSFSTASALFSGVKTNYEIGGLDSYVTLGNCSSSLESTHHLETIVSWAQKAGLHTGFVTNTRVTHATPAALYAHSPDRHWECEQNMPLEARIYGCQDIARQLIEQPIGQNLNVIMGGGRQMLVANITNNAADPLDTWACNSQDGRNLIKKWQQEKSMATKKYRVVQNTQELLELEGQSVDYVLGIFSNGHLKYNYERDKSPKGMPSLKQMTLKALEILQSRKQGFLLVVEGGLIDQAHHRGRAKVAIDEILALNDAINASLSALGTELDDTLVIVTADHSHSLTINGYPDRSTSIFGVAGKSKTENTPYTILTYGTTYKGFQVDAKGKRKNPTLQDTNDWLYTQQGAINTDENYHGGSDVTIYAKGPMSHLFFGVHEQSYVAHAISYALRIGRFMLSDTQAATHTKDCVQL